MNLVGLHTDLFLGNAKSQILYRISRIFLSAYGRVTGNTQSPLNLTVSRFTDLVYKSWLTNIC